MSTGNGERMVDSAIWELASSRESMLVCAAFVEKSVQVWDLRSRHLQHEMSTIFDSGARNLLFVPEIGILVVGRSKKRGCVAAYDIESSQKLWECQLSYPSALRLHSSGLSFYCTSRGQRIIHIDIRNGEHLEVVDKVRDYIERSSLVGISVPSDEQAPFTIFSGSTYFPLLREGFGILDVQFASESVCISEASGPVRCVSLRDGSVLWRFNPGGDGHILKLHFSQKNNAFFGTFLNYQKRAARILLSFDPVSGATYPICEFEGWTETFIEISDELVTSKGEIFNISRGSMVGRLDFPRRHYSGS